MQSKWLSHCATEEERNEFKARVLAAQPVLSRLKEVLQSKEVSVTNVTSSSYDSPSWAFKQAHNNGYAEALRDIYKYLDTTTESQ